MGILSSYVCCIQTWKRRKWWRDPQKSMSVNGLSSIRLVAKGTVSRLTTRETIQWHVADCRVQTTDRENEPTVSVGRRLSLSLPTQASTASAVLQRFTTSRPRAAQIGSNFTTRRYARAVYARVVCIRLSVCHNSEFYQRLDVGSPKQCHLWTLSFWCQRSRWNSSWVISTHSVTYVAVLCKAAVSVLCYSWFS